MTMICVPLMVETHDEAIRDAILAAEHGADMVEFRIDVYFEDQEDSTDLLQDRIDRILDLVKASPLPCVVTCRPHWEGGEYHGDDDERVSMFEALGTSDHPPAYIDVELATYTRSKNIRQKINLAVDHPKQKRTLSTRLILSTHDFEQRPSDLTRKILAMQDEKACSVMKVAYRARSIRDNLEMFELLAQRQKPMIALCMGEFGLMSRVLAPKFGGLLTFATLHDESQTAPGQPTIEELIKLYRFRKINKDTKVYGIIGWPVTQSMSPLVHNAGFEAVGWNGVYVPMPVEGSYESFKATMLALIDSSLELAGASVTIPHKENLVCVFPVLDCTASFATIHQAANTLVFEVDEYEYEGSLIRTLYSPHPENTDTFAILETVRELYPSTQGLRVMLIGAGGVARGAAHGLYEQGCVIFVANRNHSRAADLAKEVTNGKTIHARSSINAITLDQAIEQECDLYINCTPIGMTGGPDPEGLSIPIPDMTLPPETVFFDTVYNPIETPMLKAAIERGFRTIDGVQMFVKQAEAQFEMWTNKKAPADLFDQLVREKLGSDS